MYDYLTNFVGNSYIMSSLDLEKIETEIINVINKVCKQQKIDAKVDSEFCPGKFIMSQVLISIIPEIEIKTGVKVPLECYIFHENNKNREQLSIKNVAKKLINVAKDEQ